MPVFWLGVVAVLLWAISAVKPLVASWNALVATVIASLSSYVQGQRYLSLAATPESTARRLETLKDKWGASPESGAGKNALIQSCEDTMALENSAWVDEMVAAEAHSPEGVECLIQVFKRAFWRLFLESLRTC